MRVGGITLDPQFCKNVWMILFCTSSALGIFVSFSTAVLFFTAFCFGAGLLSIALDLSNGHQLPNILPSFRPPKLLGDFLCGKCKRKNCVVHFLSDPWDGYNVPIEVDEALDEFFERIINEYINPWYREVSYDEDFVQEVRHILRHTSSILLKRFHGVNVAQLILKKAIPIAVTHVDALIHADIYMEEVYGSKINKNKNIILNRRDAFVDYVGPNIHPAVCNRSREVEYTRCVTAKILPFLVPQRFQTSRLTFNLMNDLLSGAVLQPLLDILANPDIINLLIEVGFSPEPSRKFEKSCGNEVVFLDNFVTSHHTPSQSALQMDLSAILKNQSSLFAFMKFLKEEDALNQLQFCLSVEDFNKRIMTPELTTEELESLHKEATDLYDLYFRSNAKHKVNVNQEIAMDIFKILNGPERDVIKLRTTTPLFKAYEEVYSNLETKMCPLFYKSEEYFTFLLGNRQKDTSENCDKHHSRDALDSLKSGKDKGLSKIKRDMLSKPMEGLIDTNITEPAFDVANIYEQADPDETLVGSFSGVGGVAGSSLGSVLEYRDLSAWRVSIPRLCTSASGGKHCFVYEIDVQRIDIRAVSENAEDLHWKVQRQYSEFYALESKLTEFHGEFEDVKLPPKVKIFFNRGLDVMQSKIKLFEDYLIGLLQKPSLKASDLLFTFLTSPDEFTVAASYLGMGKMIKNVPIKLTKEKGQSLQPFIDNFVASTLSQSSKPRYDKDMLHTSDKDATSERIINKHELFEDNFGVNEELKIGTAYKYFSHKKSAPEITSTYDTLVYLAASLFCVPIFTLQLMLGVGIIIKNTFDHMVEYAIALKLSQVLCSRRMAFLCRLTEEAIFEPSKPRSTEEKRRRKANALLNFQKFIRPFVQCLTGEEKFESGTKFIFNGLQDPVINKQLAILLFDQIIFELFPEVAEKC